MIRGFCTPFTLDIFKDDIKRWLSNKFSVSDICLKITFSHKKVVKILSDMYLIVLSGTRENNTCMC